MSTILHRLAHWAEEAPDAPAQRFKKDGQWKDISARELRERVYHLALFLQSHGMNKSDASVILSPNCPEWVQLDLAAGLLGARSAGIYPNSTSKDIQYILGHTEAKVLAVKDKDYFRKIIGAKSEFGLPERVKLVLVFDGDTSVSPHAVSFETALKEGRKLASEQKSHQLDKFLADLDPEFGSFIIYTSGTTG
ncbi:MAG: AMP-binding protein, partial [Bdellovibrionota bacterium]